MTNQSTRVPADLADRQVQLFAVALFLFSLTFASSAAQSVVDGSAARTLAGLESATSVLALVTVAVLAVAKVRAYLAGGRERMVRVEGYVAGTVVTACAKSWAATVTLLVLGGALSAAPWLQAATIDFFVDATLATLATMLAAFSVTFFLLNAPTAAERHDPYAQT